MTLEERIKQMLEESTKQVEATPEVIAEEVVAEEVIEEEVAEEVVAEETDDDILVEYEGAPYTLGGKVDKNKIYKVHKQSASFGSEMKHNPGDTYHSLDDAKRVASNMKKGTGMKTKITVHDRTKLAGPKGHLPEDTQVSSQVAALLEAEGLSEEFKLQAVTIFEAAVTDRVLQIQEELEAEYNEKLDEAKAELETNIDGFLNEAVQEWADNNKVAIEANFKTRLAESFMDGIQSLLAEHNIALPEESEDALEIALDEVNKLEEQVSSIDDEIAELHEEIATLKAEKILESFKTKMTGTEFDRFVQLTESVKFKDESQYEKQLSIVLENFGKITAKKVEQAEQIVEQTVEAPVAQPVITETFSSVNRYAQYLAKKPA